MGKELLNDYLINISRQDLRDKRVTTIPNNEILQRVLSIVRRAKNNISITMELAEERDRPLSEEYHNAIVEAISRGVKVVRIGFGTQEDFNFMDKKLSLVYENYTFIHHPDVKSYQRLIMIDETLLFFNHEGIFYQAEDKDIIEKFSFYFKSVQ